MTRQSGREGRRSQIQANLKDRLCNRMHRGKERARLASLECWQGEEKELRLFADDGLAGEEGKFFPEERVEFRDLARSIMFAFSSRLADCCLACLLPVTKSTLRNKRVDD